MTSFQDISTCTFRYSFMKAQTIILEQFDKKHNSFPGFCLGPEIGASSKRSSYLS